MYFPVEASKSTTWNRAPRGPSSIRDHGTFTVAVRILSSSPLTEGSWAMIRSAMWVRGASGASVNSTPFRHGYPVRSWAGRASREPAVPSIRCWTEGCRTSAAVKLRAFQPSPASAQ